MKNKEHKFICTSDYINFDGNLCFKKNNTYTFTCKNNVYLTQKNHGGYSHELYLEDIENHFMLVSDLEKKGENEDSHNVIEKGEIEHKNKLNFQSDFGIKTPKHYDNSKGTLYKVAEERNWSPYLFDIVKRLERANKKGEFKTDLEKSIAVIQLWLKESKS